MCKHKRSCRSLVLSLFLVVICASVARAQSALTTLQGKQGGMITYGLVEGATTPAMAMARILHNVQNGVGEKPQVGKVFRVRGSNSDAVFFTVTNHAGGNVPVAGMLIASQTGPKAVEAALVSDAAARFGSTMNPLLSQLFGVWHPGGVAPAPAGKAPAQPGAGGGVAIPPMHQVTLPDNTASLNLPDGWNVDPKIGGGSSIVHGPRGEQIALNMWFGAQDPRGQGYRQRMQMGVQFQHIIIYPYDADLAKGYAEIFQRMRASNGVGPAPIQIDHAEMLPASPGQRCVNAEGKVNPDGKGMVETNAMLCATAPDQYGLYHFAISEYRIPLGSTDQQRATAAAIMSSYKVDTQLVQARTDAMMAPVLASMRQRWEAQEQAMVAGNQRIAGNIRQIGANATARARAEDIQHDQQHADWRQGQEENSRNTQGFSNYILDQTVVQDNNMYGNGTIGHGTVWNYQADALVKANPNRFEYVTVPNYWRGTDYVP